MHRSIIEKTLNTVTIFLIVLSCAKVSSPSGGPRDREPPVIIKSIPLSGTRNFRGREIVLSFNEYVVLDKINEKFMVSPPMKSKPGIFIRGKSIRVTFQDELRDNTTYTFYFQDAIRDLNEGNPIDNFQFVFSTGPVIDSLSLTGNLYTAFNLEVPDNTLVLLYSSMADSAVKKQLPDYITRVEKNGEFRIDNIRDGRYRLYALKDIDNSKNFNLRDEEFAFLDEPVNINSEKNYLPVVKDTTGTTSAAGKTLVKPPVEGEFKLILFPAEKKLRYLTSSDRKMPYQLMYTLSLPPDSLKFNLSIPEAGDDSFFIERNRNRDTITVWLTDSTLYSRTQIQTIVNYPFTDSLGLQVYIEDTIMMRFLAPRATRAKIKRTPYRVNTGITGSQYGIHKQIILKSPTPFIEPDTSRIRLYELAKEQRLLVPVNLERDTTNSCRYIMNADLQEGKSYLFITDSAAFRNIYGEYSDSTGVKFTVRTADSYGRLILNITNYEGDRIIQLLSSAEKLIKEVHMKEDGTLEFPNLEKGFYRLRVIYDLNGDGKWTTGDFDTGRQPEPVSYYPGEIEIKVLWDVTQPWDIGTFNIKDYKLRSAQKSLR